MRPLQAGQVVDGFRLEERLHQGGLATIWAVTHPDHAPPLVMKVPHLDPDDGPGAIVGFEVEFAILPLLSGPHVPGFVAGAFTRPPYIVMRRIEGTVLSDLIGGERLPVERIAAIGASIAKALHSVHGQHVIHHDVKPGNIILRPSGEAVLIDFGLARHEDLPDLLAEEGEAPIGTGIYISPEQILRDRAEPRSDIFAAGALLYELTTGERPFGTPTSTKQMRRRLWQEPMPPRRLRPDCPDWLQEIILRCLEVDPDDRFPTAAQLGFALSHPDSVTLTARARRTERPGFLDSLRRRLRARATEARPSRSVSGLLASAPLIMVAVDLAPEASELAQAVRTIIRRILEIEPAARLTCVNVIKASRLRVDVLEDEQGRNLYIERLVELRHWAHPLDVAADRITFHILTAFDPADALVDYARANDVDHIVLGARGASTLRRYLGSVSSQVVAAAPCTVTIVRARPLSQVFDRAEPPPHGEPDPARP